MHLQNENKDTNCNKMNNPKIKTFMIEIKKLILNENVFVQINVVLNKMALKSSPKIMIISPIIKPRSRK